MKRWDSQRKGRAKRLEIEDRRREWKRRIPKPMDTNLAWGLDLTGKSDTQGVIHPILGIVDHGSRLAVSLTALRTRSTIAILRALLDAIERYVLPRAVRTDNDGAFTSRVFAFALALLGIRPREEAGNENAAEEISHGPKYTGDCQTTFRTHAMRVPKASRCAP